MSGIIRHKDGLAYVPLGIRGAKGTAIVYEDDLSTLEDLGLSMRWNRHPKTGAVFAPASKASGGNVLVSRVLVNAGPGQNVTHRNSDPSDLRRQNLQIIAGNATRRDRDYLTSKSNRKAWGPSVEHGEVLDHKHPETTD